MQEVRMGLEFFIKFLACLKNLEIQYEYAIENNGSVTCWTEIPQNGRITYTRCSMGSSEIKYNQWQ
ncbi:MAG: hypothetical protein IKN30_03330 [Synergistaceae bacterium]|nr:hypothetical protein [Synergistaceae bacterium]